MNHRGDRHTKLNDRRSKAENDKIFIVWFKAYHILCFESGVDRLIIYYTGIGHDVPTFVLQVHVHNKAIPSHCGKVDYLSQAVHAI